MMLSSQYKELNRNILLLLLLNRNIGKMARSSCLSFGQTTFCYEGTRACATFWMALWPLDALCYEGCEGHGTANGLPQPEWNWLKEAMNIPIWAGIVDGAKLF